MVHIPPDLPEASPTIISESETHIVVATEKPSRRSPGIGDSWNCFWLRPSV